MYSRDLFPKKSFFSHKNGTFYKQELWTSLAAAAALSSCWCVKTVYGIWIYTSVFIKLFSHVDHETLGVMAEYRNQNFIFTWYMILPAFEKKNSYILLFFFKFYSDSCSSSLLFVLILRPSTLVSRCQVMLVCILLLVLLPTMLFWLPTIIRIEKKKTKADMKKQPSSVVSSISSKRSKKAGEGQQKTKRKLVDDG